MSNQSFKLNRTKLSLITIVVLMFGIVAILYFSQGPNNPFPPPNEGRMLATADWVAHLPLACVTILVVIAMNGVFIGKIMQNRRKGNRRG